MIRVLFTLLITIIMQPVVAATSPHWPIEEPYYNLKDKVSLQRGARIFVNYCQGCHSAQFVRYRRLANDIGIVDDKGVILTSVLRENLMYGTDKLGDTIQTAMSPEDAKKWFLSASPPDLSLVARKRGAGWLYTYLNSFYVDETRPWGVNNALFENVAMPHVLLELQGIQRPVYKTVKIGDSQQKIIERLELIDAGRLNSEEYKAFLIDLVNFLVYIGEPMKLERQRVGVWVVLFVILFSLLALFLKRAFWKDIHSGGH